MALTSSELLAKIFFCSILNHVLSTIFQSYFFFSSFVGQVVALISSELLGKIFFPSFVGQVVAPTSSELLAKIFFTSFVGQVVALTSSELLAKIFLFSFESCPFNNISVRRIF